MGERRCSVKRHRNVYTRGGSGSRNPSSCTVTRTRLSRVLEDWFSSGAFVILSSTSSSQNFLVPRTPAREKDKEDTVGCVFTSVPRFSCGSSACRTTYIRIFWMEHGWVLGNRAPFNEMPPPLPPCKCNEPKFRLPLAFWRLSDRPNNAKCALEVGANTTHWNVAREKEGFAFKLSRKRMDKRIDREKILTTLLNTREDCEVIWDVFTCL